MFRILSSMFSPTLNSVRSLCICQPGRCRCMSHMARLRSTLPHQMTSSNLGGHRSSNTCSFIRGSVEIWGILGDTFMFNPVQWKTIRQTVDMNIQDLSRYCPVKYVITLQNGQSLDKLCTNMRLYMSMTDSTCNLVDRLWTLVGYGHTLDKVWTWTIRF